MYLSISSLPVLFLNFSSPSPSAARGGYYDEDEEGSMDNFIIDDGLDADEEVRHVQYNTVLYNTIQYNTIQYNTIQYNTIK